MPQETYKDQIYYYEEEYDEPFDYDADEDISIESDSAKMRINLFNKYLLLGFAMFLDMVELTLFVFSLGTFGTIIGSAVSIWSYFVLWIWFKILGIDYIERVFAGKISRKVVKLIAWIMDVSVAVLPAKTILMYLLIKEIEVVDKTNIKKYLDIVEKYK